MLYRFNVLGTEGLYEGWAHTLAEMKERYAEKYGEGDCEVFFVGGAPKHLSLEEYRQAMLELDNHKLVMIFDEKVGKLLSIIE